MTRYFYHHDKMLVAVLSHKSDHLYELTIWRATYAWRDGGLRRREQIEVQDVMPKKQAFQVLEGFLEYDLELADHLNEDDHFQLDLGGRE